MCKSRAGFPVEQRSLPGHLSTAALCIRHRLKKKGQLKNSFEKVTAKLCFKGWKAPYPLNASPHIDSCDLQRPLGAAAHHIKGVSVGLGVQTWNIQVP